MQKSSVESRGEESGAVSWDLGASICEHIPENAQDNVQLSHHRPVSMTTDSSSFQSKIQRTSHYSNSIHSSNQVRIRGLTSTPFTLLRPEGYGYTAVDPYAASISQSIHNLSYTRDETDSSLEDIDVPDHQSYSHPYQHSIIAVSVKEGSENQEPPTLSTYITAFIFDTIPRLLYSYTLLRLPSLYFSRVARVFEDADLSMPEIKRMALELANQYTENVHQVLFTNLSNQAPPSSPFWDLKTNWESFIDSLLREWKTLNIISVLLLSAILTVLQIDAAANDPLTRYSALLSLICALMSLLYGCVFIIRFGGMKKPHKAAEWAWEARRTRTLIWWNVWVMLAMPAIWLSWSVVTYIVCIMAFVWRTGSTQDGTLFFPLEPRLAFWPRLLISVTLGLGVIYFILITATLSRYGSKMDRKWRDRVKGWTDRLIYEQPFPEHMAHFTQWNASMPGVVQKKASFDFYSKPFVPRGSNYTRSPSPMSSPPHSDVGHNRPSDDGSASGQDGLPTPIQTCRAIALRFHDVESSSLPPDVEARHISIETWTRFTHEIGGGWNEPHLPGSHGITPQASVLRIISLWNASVFERLCIEAILCQEFYSEWPESPLFSVYLVDRRPVLGRTPRLEERFGSVPPGLIRLDLLDFSNFQHNWITLFPERDTEVQFETPRAPLPKHNIRRNSNGRSQIFGDEEIYNEDDVRRNDDGGVNEEEGDTVVPTRSKLPFVGPSRRPPTPRPGSRLSGSRTSQSGESLD